MVKKLFKNFSLKDKAGDWKTKELLQAGSALAELAGGKNYAKNVSSFDEQDTEEAAGIKNTSPESRGDHKKKKASSDTTGY